jgi:hypothetical protein
MSVCCECCVLSDRGLWDELITRPEESYRLWCVVACDLEKQNPREWGRPRPPGGLSRQKNALIINNGTDCRLQQNNFQLQNFPPQFKEKSIGSILGLSANYQFIHFIKEMQLI